MWEPRVQGLDKGGPKMPKIREDVKMMRDISRCLQ